MPESKSRKKRPEEQTPAVAKPQGNPAWLVPTMLGLMVVGLLWIVSYYVLAPDFPIPGIGNWNLAVGFALLFAGFALTLRWR